MHSLQYRSAVERSGAHMAPAPGRHSIWPPVEVPSGPMVPVAQPRHEMEESVSLRDIRYPQNDRSSPRASSAHGSESSTRRRNPASPCHGADYQEFMYNLDVEDETLLPPLPTGLAIPDSQNL